MAIAHAGVDVFGDIATASGTTVITLGSSTSTNVNIVAFCYDDATGGSPTITAPSGWTTVNTSIRQVNVNSVTLFAFWALGSVSSKTFTTGTAQSLGWACVAFSGVDNTTPIDAVGATVGINNSKPITASAVTISASGQNAWELIACGDWNSGQYSATGFTNAEKATIANAAAGLLYNTTPKSVGSTGTVVVTDNASATSQALVVMPFALRPAGAATRSLFRTGLSVSEGAGGSYFGNPIGKWEGNSNSGSHGRKRRPRYVRIGET